MSPKERAEALAKYFDWDIPSEQFHTILHQFPMRSHCERLACAKVAEIYDEVYPDGKTIAAAIRGYPF
jgi:hypothetical protein